MKITAYNQHDVGSFSSLGRFRHYQSTRCNEPTSLCNQAKRRISVFSLRAHLMPHPARDDKPLFPNNLASCG
jgi:hypothetical protein